MADSLDCIKGKLHINTTTTETVELGSSRQDVRMVVKASSERTGEGALECKSATDFFIGVPLVKSTGSKIATIARTVIDRARLHAISITLTRFIASLADVNVKKLVSRHSLVNDFRDHAVNFEADFTLSLELTEVLLGGLPLIVLFSKSIRDQVLRNSSLIVLGDHLIMNRGLHLVVLQKTQEGISFEAEVTVLAGDCGRSLMLIVIGILKHGAKVHFHAVIGDGQDPAMRPAGSDKSLKNGVEKASRRGGRGRSRRSNVDVCRDSLVEPHGSRIACRHEEDKLVEHILLLHGTKAEGKILISEVLSIG